MATVSQQHVKTRFERSNSLQKMLELEKEATARRQAMRTSPPASIPYTATKPAVGKQGVPAPKTLQRKNRPVLGSPPVGASAAPQLPPLSKSPSLDISAKTPTHYSASSKPGKPFPLRANSKNADFPETASLHNGKTSLDERRSICQSPSWEAYGRRKQEKREEKQEKREMDQAMKEAQRAKRSRLSKQPPPCAGLNKTNANSGGSVMRHSRKNASDVAIRGRQPSTERPASVMGLVTGPDSSAEPVKRERRRSGSFSSFIKAFDLRKHYDEDDTNKNGGGFIGGIKLEHERFQASQPAASPVPGLDKNKNEVHPALRPQPLVQQPVPPLRVSPARARAETDGGKKSYPPIAMLTTSPQTRELLPPSVAAAASDLSTIDKWRARVGFKRSSRHESPESDGKNNDGASGAAPSDKVVISAPMINSETHKKLNTAAGSTLTAPPRPAQKLQENSAQKSSVAVAPRQAKDDKPPAPPRRSSKRKSFVNVDDILFRPIPPTLPLSRVSAATHGQSSSLSSSSPSSSVSSVPATPLLENVNRHLDAHYRKQQQQQQHSSSEEDSGSDYSHSASLPSTPATSRPQSDSGMSPIVADIERFFELDRPYTDGMEEYDSLSPDVNSGEQRSQPKPMAKQKRSFPLAPRRPVETTTKTGVVEPVVEGPILEKELSAKEERLTGGIKPVKKTFVECCSCHQYHDVPFALYQQANFGDAEKGAEERKCRGKTIDCSWCQHGMSGRCCSSLATMVYVKERR